MRVLIVGCGYIGSRLGAELARRGHDVFGMRRSAASEAELRAVGIQCVVADITQPASLARVPAAYDWVCNCVSATGGDARDYLATYVEGMRHLLDWLAASPPRKFIYTSSTGVYGQTDGAWVDETSPTEPASSTGKLLVKTERLLLEAAAAGRMPGIVLRLAGIYGPGRGYWLKQFLKGEARVEGRGERVLNMIHREDVLGGILAALERGGSGQVYNVVDNEPVTQASLLEWLAQHVGRPLPPPSPEPDAAARRRGVTSKRVSNRRLRSELGYSLQYPSFREGFAQELRAVTGA